MIFTRWVSRCDSCLLQFIHMPHVPPRCQCDDAVLYTRIPKDELFTAPGLTLCYCIHCRHILIGGPFAQGSCSRCKKLNYKLLTPDMVI